MVAQRVIVIAARRRKIVLYFSAACELCWIVNLHFRCNLHRFISMAIEIVKYLDLGGT